MTNPEKTASLAELWEQVNAWNAELDAIEQALDEAEARQASIEERMQETVPHPALSPIGVLPPKPSRGKSVSRPAPSSENLESRSLPPPAVVQKPKGISKK